MLVSACGSGEGARGTLSILLEAEETITQGIEPGNDSENTRDGWAVAFKNYVVAIGDVEVHLASNENSRSRAEDVFVADLTQVPASGLPLWELRDLPAGRWEFHYHTPGANGDSLRHESVSEPDYDQLVENGWTYLVAGSLEKEDGQSCPPESLVSVGDRSPNGSTRGGNPCYDATEISFSFGATADTSFGPCEVDEIPGVIVSEGSTQTVAVTIHGDHLFFNGFPEGSEGGTLRLAQWLADCDLDLDGNVTRDELEAITPADLAEIDDRYQLGGSPLTPLTTMIDYLAAQLMTQGHFQGEGECPIKRRGPRLRRAGQAFGYATSSAFRRKPPSFEVNVLTDTLCPGDQSAP